MTKEELIKLSRENLRKSKQGSLCECYDEAFIKGYQLSEKRIAELEAQIERNKIDLAISEHDREHDDYELTEVYKKIEQLEKENAELKIRVEKQNADILTLKALTERQRDQLTKAKEIIGEYINILKGETKNWKKTQEKAEQFLKGCEVEK